MPECVKKRTSKWDVMAETHGPTEIRQDNALPVKADNSFKEQESNLNWNSSQSNWPDMRTDTNMLYKDGPDANQFSKLARLEEVDIGISKDCPGMFQSPTCSDMEASIADGSKRSCWESKSGNQIAAKDGNMPVSPKCLDVEAGGKDGSKWSQWKSVSGNQVTTKDSCITDGRDTDLNQSYSTSMSPGLDAWRQDSHSISPRHGWSISHRCKGRSRSRSRSWSRSRSRGRGRSRSRSRSPSHGLNRRSERWVERGRMRAGGSAAPCRNFTAGRCMRGGGRRHFDSNYRYEKVGYSEHGNKENFVESWEHRDYLRDRSSQRHGSNYDGNRENPELHRNNRTVQRCYDFTKGRCYRGSSCRYVHHDASSDGGWHMKDEARERTHDRRDANTYFGRGPEPRTVSDVPCKYFAEGRCHHGEGCKFSHQGVPRGHLDGRRHDEKWDGMEANYCSSRTSSHWGDKTAAVDATDSPWVADKNSLGVAVIQTVRREDIGHRPPHLQSLNPQHNRYQMLPQDAAQKTLSSLEHNITQEASGQDHNVPTVATQVMAENTNVQHHPETEESGTIVHNARSQSEMSFANNLLTVATVPGQNFIQGGQSQYVVPQPLHVQSFTPNIQVHQAFPPLPFNGQVQQAYTLLSNGQSQFIIPQAPPNAQSFNLSLPSQPVFSHHGQSQPNFNVSGQMQQNLPANNGQNHQSFNLSGQIQSLPPPHNAQSQPNFHIIDQIQQGLPVPHNGQNLQNINIGAQSQQSLIPPPQGEQSQHIVPPVAPNEQNQHAPPQPVPDPKSFNSGDSQQQANLHHHTQKVGEESTLKLGMSQIKPTQLSSGTPVTQKVVTSEQAAQITNLSASLAQFFGNGPQLPQFYSALNPQSTTGQVPSQLVFSPSAMGSAAPPAAALFLLPGQGSWTQPQPEPMADSTDPAKLDASNIPPGFSSVCVEQKDPNLEESETKLKSSSPLSATCDTKDGNQTTHEPKQVEVELSGSTASKEVNDAEIGESKKEQTAHSGDVEVDARTDGESKRSKDAKGSRMFKCALVEFVKDALKPAWKEGHLSKEVHKTVVKKVVDKVTGAMQSSNIPQTQERIDFYMAYSKAKLNKLVQAYLEKYV